jgi:crotonobetainyl-CoA:carnitine CoA-transferase CaiB-like acyl-CoA transferase
MIALAVGNDGQFAKLAEVLGHPEWAQDERFRTNTARVQHREIVDGLVAESFKTMQSKDIISTLRKNGIPVGAVNTVAEALSSEHAQVKEMVVDIAHEKIGTFKSLGTPLKMHQTPTSVRSAPPMLGQHTDEILKKYLQLSDTELSDLRAKNIIQ